MSLSRSSKTPPDPLSGVLDTFGASVTRRTRLEAAGQWALGFPSADRLKFVTVLRGRCWMLLPGRVPRLMDAGEVCLLGRTPYTVASDPETAPVDGRTFFEAPDCDVAHVGGKDMIALGGTVAFVGANADFLLEMLPDFMFFPPSSRATGAVAAILGLVNEEVERNLIGSEIVNTRLADILVVEAIRAYSANARSFGVGWLGAVSDPRLGRVLRAIHADLGKPWTVGGLASVAGMSRAAFSAEFTYRVGQSPLAYIRTWRLAAARAILASGEATVASVASKVGYTSHSAFGHAYRRAFGTSPKDGVPSRRTAGPLAPYPR